MTREEIIKLLNILRSAYPNMKPINDPKGMADNWERELGQYPAQTIYMAARHHINSSSFFPNVADIKKSINKGLLIYGSAPETAPRIGTKEKDIRNKLCLGSEICPYFDADLCHGTEAEQKICRL